MAVRMFTALTALIALARADVKFTTPAAGASVSGTTISIKWADSGTSPPISSLVSYELFLCAGGNDPSTITVLTSLKSQGDFTQGNSIDVEVQPTLGGDTKNAYFLKMISAATGGVVVNYSSRFSLPAMSGTFPAGVQSALKSISGTSGPATQNQIAVVNPDAGGAAGDFGVAYSLQTGPTRYAPMAKRPGTKITKNHASPLYPKSSYTPFQQPAAPAVPQITFTKPDTVVVVSREPTMPAAAMPHDSDMQKFLNRWKD